MNTVTTTGTTGQWIDWTKTHQQYSSWTKTNQPYNTASTTIYTTNETIKLTEDDIASVKEDKINSLYKEAINDLLKEYSSIEYIVSFYYYGQDPEFDDPLDIVISKPLSENPKLKDIINLAKKEFLSDNPDKIILNYEISRPKIMGEIEIDQIKDKAQHEWTITHK